MEVLIGVIKDEDGQGLVEYSLIISLVILLLIGALRGFGQDVLKYFTIIEANMPK